MGATILMIVHRRKAAGGNSQDAAKACNGRTLQVRQRSNLSI